MTICATLHRGCVSKAQASMHSHLADALQNLNPACHHNAAGGKRISLQMVNAVQVAKASVEGMERIVYVEVFILASRLHTCSGWQHFCSSTFLAFHDLCK